MSKAKETTGNEAAETKQADKQAADKANAAAKLAEAAEAKMESLEVELRAEVDLMLGAMAGHVSGKVRVGQKLLRATAAYWERSYSGQLPDLIPVKRNKKGEAIQPKQSAKVRAYVEQRMLAADSQASAAVLLDCVRHAQRLTVLYADFAAAAASLKRVGSKAGVSALMSLAAARGKVWGKSESIRADIAPILARADSLEGPVLKALLVDAGAIAAPKPGKTLAQRIADLDAPELAPMLASRGDLGQLLRALPVQAVAEWLCSENGHKALTSATMAVEAQREADKAIAERNRLEAKKVA